MVKILKDLIPNDGTGRGHVGMEASLRSEGRKKKDAALPSETDRDTECVKETTAPKENSTAHRHFILLERRAFLSRITRPTGPASNWLEDENYAAANVESNCELHPGCGSVCAGFWRKPSTPGKYKLCGRAGLHRRAAPRQQGDRFGRITGGAIARYSDWEGGDFFYPRPFFYAPLPHPLPPTFPPI